MKKSPFLIKKEIVALGILLCTLAGTSTVFALNSLSTGYRLITTAQEITAYNTCYSARTTSGSDVFLPTNTEVEWNAFIANKPSNVSLSACTPACSGVSYGGYCWYSGVASNGATVPSCNTVCATHGGVNLAGLRNYVGGTGGTIQNCKNVMGALGRPTNAGLSDQPQCYEGCLFQDARAKYGNSAKYMYVIRCGAQTDPAYTSPTQQGYTVYRACSCNN